MSEREGVSGCFSRADFLDCRIMGRQNGARGSERGEGIEQGEEGVLSREVGGRVRRGREERQQGRREC